MHKCKTVYLPRDDEEREVTIQKALDQIDAEAGTVISHSQEGLQLIIIYRVQA